MGKNEIAKGTELYSGLMEENVLYLILKGSIKVSFSSGEFVLKTGDVAGILEVGYEDRSLNYTALEDSTVVEYKYIPGDIRFLLSENKDILKYLMTSLYKQLGEVANVYRSLKKDLFGLREFIITTYEDYEAYCESIGASPSDIADYDEVIDISTVELLPEWLTGYHIGTRTLLKEHNMSEIEPDLLTGTIIRTAEDVQKMARIADDIISRKSDMINILLGENGGDMFEIYESLYVRAVKNQGLNSPVTIDVYNKLKAIMLKSEEMGIGEEPYYARRLMQYDEVISEAGEIAASNDENSEKYGEDMVAELSDSLNKILNYSTLEDDFKDNFEKHVNAYKGTVNKSASNEELTKLRKQITAEFNELYKDCFLKSATEDKKDIPIPVLLLLEFGYVDEALCGMDNAVFLSRAAKHMPTEPNKGVYSFREWLMEIYEGKKDPGRNEFDVDYAEFLREEAHANRISKEEEKALFTDSVARASYEIDNVFTQVNKMTTGRITTFCPLLSEHNFIKKVKSMLVTAGQILKNIDDIRRIDFTAFYRPAVYANPDCGITREFIDVEVLPNIILTPNIGSRPVMWQEIEGRRRTTPARMFISALQQEDVYMQLLKMTGNFRWEMCKRIQGGRWNDISEKSLTSEYFDYVQYYRKNNELSTEAKAKVKNELVRAKNSFREMFIKDYMTYIQFESQGSPRLNKVARTILLTYVPLKSELRKKLQINPMYKPIIERYEVKQKAKAHRMDNLMLKIQNSGHEIPDEIKQQSEYLLK